jgi:hypothetical protein
VSFVSRLITPSLGILDFDWLLVGVLFMYFYISNEVHSVLPPVWYLHEDFTLFLSMLQAKIFESQMN